MALHYFPLQLRFSASALCCHEQVQNGILVFLSMPSVQKMLCKSNSVWFHIILLLHLKIQELKKYRSYLGSGKITGLPILIQVTTRYKLYRHLMNEGLPLNESVSQSSRGNSWKKILGVCEGTVKLMHFMRLQCVCSRYMQAALYSWIDHQHITGNLGFWESFLSLCASVPLYESQDNVFGAPWMNRTSSAAKCQVLKSITGLPHLFYPTI